MSSFLPLELMKLIKERFHGNRIEKEFSVAGIEGSLLFLDISGFSKLTETLSSTKHGAEEMSRHINGYFEKLLKVCHRWGGDIERWAGDAMLCMFYGKDLKVSTRLAVQCGMEIQTLDELRVHVVEDVALTLHCGVASGNFDVLHIGGVRGKWHRIMIGDPLSAIEQAVSESRTGEVMISGDTYPIISEFVKVLPIVNSKAVLLKEIVTPISPLLNDPLILVNAMEPAMRCFIDALTEQKIDAQQVENKLLSSLRRCTMVFITLSPRKTLNQHLAIFQSHLHFIQAVLDRYEGSMANFLSDEKGILCALCFGYPFSHANDAYRSLLSAIDIKKYLESQNDFHFGIGVATGSVFIGTIGNIDRRDITALGASCNIAARMMKISQFEKSSAIIIDQQTNQEVESRIFTKFLEIKKLKGMENEIEVFECISVKKGEFLLANASVKTTIRTEELDNITNIFSLEADKSPIILLKTEGPGNGVSRLLHSVYMRQSEFEKKSYYFLGDGTQKKQDLSFFKTWINVLIAQYKMKTIDNVEHVQYDELKDNLLKMCCKEKAVLLQTLLSNPSQKSYLGLLNKLTDTNFPITNEIAMFVI